MNFLPGAGFIYRPDAGTLHIFTPAFRAAGPTIYVDDSGNAVSPDEAREVWFGGEDDDA